MPTTYYIWDFENDSYLMEKDETGATTAVYTNEPEQYGRMISQHRDNQTNYYHFDGQQSTRQLTDQDQNVTDEYTYAAFGETVTTSGATINPFWYKGALGYYADSGAMRHNLRQRDYVALYARWLSADPGWASGALNSYAYLNNSPLTQNQVRFPTHYPLVVKPGGFETVNTVYGPIGMTPPKCLKCGGHDVWWVFDVTGGFLGFPPDPKKAQWIAVVHELSIKIDYTHSCKFTEECEPKCVPGPRTVCQLTVYEFLGLARRSFAFGKAELNVTDHWSMKPKGSTRCSTKGNAIWNGNVRGFVVGKDIKITDLPGDAQRKIDPTIPITDEPEGGGSYPPNVVMMKCTEGSESFRLGYHWPFAPSFWNNPHTSARTHLNSEWKCCEGLEQITIINPPFYEPNSNTSPRPALVGQICYNS